MELDMAREPRESRLDQIGGHPHHLRIPIDRESDGPEPRQDLGDRYAETHLSEDVDRSFVDALRYRFGQPLP
jgi:hypothetical protein